MNIFGKLAFTAVLAGAFISSGCDPNKGSPGDGPKLPRPKNQTEGTPQPPVTSHSPNAKKDINFQKFGVIKELTMKRLDCRRVTLW
jgi:hypothetical protein